MGRLESRVSRESPECLDQWEPPETRDPWETRGLRDLPESQDLEGPGEILVKTAPPESPDLRASPDLQEREEWSAPPAPGVSRGCRGRPGKMESRAGTEQPGCRDRPA